MLFTKMHILNTDYLVCEYQNNLDFEKVAVKVLDRILGIGSSMLVVCNLNTIEMKCYDQLGNEVLGVDTNALFCFTKYASMHKVKFRRSAFLEILADNQLNEVELICENPFLARVNVGKPQYSNSMLRVNDMLDSWNRQLYINEDMITTFSLYLGQICTVVIVNDFDCLANKYIDLIANHKIFSYKTLVGLAKVIDKKTVVAKLYDPKYGFVKSNSSLTGAIAVTLEKQKLVGKDVTINLDSGSQDVLIRKDGIYVEGSVEVLFECEY